MKKYIVGVDLGGTKITTAVSDLKGRMISKITIPTQAQEGAEMVFNRVEATILGVLGNADISAADVLSIGVGSPGIIDPDAGMILKAANLPFANFNLVKLITEAFHIPTFLENDANAAALGEFTFGSGRGRKNFIYITVSTGVGGAAIINGKLYRGNTANAFEVGHMILDPKSTIRCNCGLYGDVESLCSGTAIAKRAVEAIGLGKETSLKAVGNISTKDVYEAYQNGDEVSRDILYEAFDYMGIAVANLITIFDPEMIVIGGGVSAIGELFFSRIKESATRNCLNFLFDPVEILPSSLGQEAGVMGALAVAKRRKKA